MILPDAALSDATREVSAAASLPRIVWPTMVLGKKSYEEGDLEWFPEDHRYRERAKLGIGGAMSQVFREVVRLANNRIWLLDEQLLRDDKSAHLLGGVDSKDSHFAGSMIHMWTPPLARAFCRNV